MMPEGFWPDELSVKQVETERLRRNINFHLNTICRLTTENERLRDALKQAADDLDENGLPTEARKARCALSCG